jgi:hypothetical protein
MKKMIVPAILLATNIITAFCLLRMFWVKTLWEMESRTTAQFAARVWASSDYSKGKLSKLRLIIEQEPKGYFPRPTVFDGPFVVREWIGYTDPFPLLGGEDSPSIQTARITVASYNEVMLECHEHPEEYKKRLASERESWKGVILGTKEGASKPDARDGK